MKNKVLFKKYGILFFLVAFIFGLAIFLVNLRETENYKILTNEKISSIIEIVKNKYPNISDNEIMEMLTSEEFNGKSLKIYGYDIEEDFFIKSMDQKSHKFTMIEVILFASCILILSIIIYTYNRHKDKEIEKITKIIENINHKNYELKLDEYSEDELSILKSEIYKTTLMLKEAAENSLEDKINLKNSLSDISHQLKTPLTSILIMLDNIIEDEDMDSKTRDDFIKDIKREIVKINFLVQSILKLSKFESNTINLLNERVSICELLDETIKNVSSLSDLKNIEIKCIKNAHFYINCDFAWQVEAIGNILKNALEHSYKDSEILITINENNVYKELIIEDFGEGMSPEDTGHIFERFYKSKNSTKDSIGIGLELSKRIIEASNGRISVKSEPNKGTKFIIKYF